MSEEFMSSARERRMDRPIILKKALAKARSAELEQIDPSSFNYADVDEDAEYVERMEEIFAKQAKESPELKEAAELAEIFEAIVSEQIELSNWLGENVTTRKTCRFDDIKNGVDTVLAIEKEGATSHMALAIDVTYGQNIIDKFERIKREISAGTLANVKYFESGDGDFRGQLMKIPRVVVGADRINVIRLAGKWVGGEKRSLASDFIQLQLLEEITEQLREFSAYAKKSEQTDLVRIYDRYLNVFQQIMRQKQQMLEGSDDDSDYREKDRVFSSIRENLLFFNKEY